MQTYVQQFWNWLLPLLLLPGLSFMNMEPALARQAEPDHPDPFRVRWEDTDGAVGGGQARSWLWGPAPLLTVAEPQADGSDRRVQYWDKGRMEQTGVDLADPWSVTGGLVGRELLDARAPLPVVGDDDPALNPLAPTYAGLAGLTSVTDQVLPTAAVATLLSPAGTPLFLPDLAAAYTETQAVALDTGEVYPIPQVFWDLFQAIEIATGTPWLVPIGHALSEPYWTLTAVDQQLRLVLVQVYERRVLTYTPHNPDGWRVELGNAGRHAWLWHYHREIEHQ